MGEGGFSIVWLAEDTSVGAQVAIKIYANGDRLDTQGIENFREEYNLVRNLNHTNLLKTDYMDNWMQCPFLVMPYCAKGSVFNHYLIGEGRIEEQDCWKILHDVAAGLAYLHKNKVVHKDIKPDNILIADDGHFMITDFGISVKLRKTMTVKQNEIAGTYRYMPPEYFGSNPLSKPEGDIWALGAMMYELMTGGKAPFGDDGGSQQRLGLPIEPIKSDRSFSSGLKQLVYKCLAGDENARPTAEGIVKTSKDELQTNHQQTLPLSSDKDRSLSENNSDGSSYDTLFYYGKYRLVELLGAGYFSQVWLAEDTLVGTQVAIKIYANGDRLDTQGIENFREEYNLVRNLNHTNLLKTDYMDNWMQCPFLVMPYCAKGSVFNHYLIGEGRIEEQDCWKILHDVAAGLAYLHKNKVVHKDIKPDNILIADDGHFMITDFGISVKLRKTMTVKQNEIAGTYRYMPPEYFGSNPLSKPEGDIWALGAMMYELMTGGKAPFGDDGGSQQRLGLPIEPIKSDRSFSSGLKQLVYKCLAGDEDARPTAEEIVKICTDELQMDNSSHDDFLNNDKYKSLADSKDSESQQEEYKVGQEKQSWLSLWKEKLRYMNTNRQYLFFLALIFLVVTFLIKICKEPPKPAPFVAMEDPIPQDTLSQLRMNQAVDLLAEGDNLMKDNPYTKLEPSIAIDSKYIQAFDICKQILNNNRTIDSQIRKCAEEGLKHARDSMLSLYNEFERMSAPRQEDVERKELLDKKLHEE